MNKEQYRKARDYAMAKARRSVARAALCDREDKPDWAAYSREQVVLYVKDARYFNRKAMQS